MSNELNMVENAVENKELIEDTVKAGTEIATKVVKDPSALKRFGKAAGLVAIGAIVYKGAELAVDFGKKKINNWRKKKTKPVEGPGENVEETEKTENIED